jgi:acylphosphatase
VRRGGGKGPLAARRILVEGRVQGVGYRWAAMVRAEGFGVAGWVRNLPDGRVEVHAQGEPGAVEALVAFLREGPQGAEVSRLEEEMVAATPGLEGFVIRW